MALRPDWQSHIRSTAAREVASTHITTVCGWRISLICWARHQAQVRAQVAIASASRESVAWVCVTQQQCRWRTGPSAGSRQGSADQQFVTVPTRVQKPTASQSLNGNNSLGGPATSPVVRTTEVPPGSAPSAQPRAQRSRANAVPPRPPVQEDRSARRWFSRRQDPAQRP